MTATEWNSFTNRINEYRAYNELSDYNFTTVASEMQASQSIINEAVEAINEMGYSIPKIGNDITAQTFIDLVNTINGIV